METLLNILFWLFISIPIGLLIVQLVLAWVLFGVTVLTSIFSA